MDMVSIFLAMAGMFITGRLWDQLDVRHEERAHKEAGRLPHGPL